MVTGTHQEFLYQDKLKVIELRLVSDENGQESCAWIAPDYGMNLCRLRIGKDTVIDFDLEALTDDFSGTPLLYPTPNRVYHGVFRYQGKTYVQEKRGVLVTSHGLLYNEPLSVDGIEETTESIAIKGHADFLPGKAYFEAFPFVHRLSVSYTLTLDGIRFDYRIENMGNMELPYGIALHPYFIKLDGEEDTLITAPYQATYLNIEEDLIPTGYLEQTEGKETDLNKYRSVGSCDLDHVYTGYHGGETAILYRKRKKKVVLQASEEFTHLVVYTPPGMPFFCMENQTCATDAHNLYAKGFQKESGLEFVKSGASAGGFISYRIEDVPSPEGESFSN